MTNVLVRNLDKGVHAIIKARAESSGVTATEEFHKALNWWVGDSQFAAVCRENEALKSELVKYKVLVDTFRSLVANVE